MSKSLINQLVILLSDDQPKVQVRATRELKRLAETKSRFNSDQLRVIFADGTETLGIKVAHLSDVVAPKNTERVSSSSRLVS
jgi:hypothetical protein